jgi:hypothetical protein
VRDEIVYALGEKGVQLVVRVGFDLRVGAKGETKEAPNARSYIA